MPGSGPLSGGDGPFSGSRPSQRMGGQRSATAGVLSSMTSITPMAVRDEQHHNELARLAGLSRVEQGPADEVLQASVENWDADSPERPSADGLRRRSETYLEAATGSGAGGGGGGGAGGQQGRKQVPKQQGGGERFSKKAANSSPEALNSVFNSSYSLLPPISITMILVVVFLKMIPSYQETAERGFGYTKQKESADDTTGEQVLGGLMMALIVVACVIVMTFMLVGLIYFKCYKILAGYGALVGAALLIYFSGMFVISLCQAYNLPVDYPMLGFMVWNYFVVGALALGGFSGISQERADGSRFFNYLKLWGCPLRVIQFYHITVCTVVALLIQQMLPPWTAWMVLALMAVWDLFAVLSDKGPLNCLIKIIDDRDIQFPDALIYSTMITMVDTDETTGPAAAQRARAAAQRALRQPSEPDVERAAKARKPSTKPAKAAAAPAKKEESGSGPKLGLGDFIFYSILMAAASRNGSWGTIFACYLAIILGLVATLYILILYGKALPALPISVFLAILTYFASRELLEPMLDGMVIDMVFI